MTTHVIKNSEDFSVLVTDDTLQSFRARGGLISLYFRDLKFTRADVGRLSKLVDFVEVVSFCKVVFEDDVLKRDLLTAIAECPGFNELLLWWGDPFNMGKCLSPSQCHPISKVLVSLFLSYSALQKKTAKALAKALQYNDVLKVLEVSNLAANETDMTPIFITKHGLEKMLLSFYDLTEEELFALCSRNNGRVYLGLRTLRISLNSDSQDHSERLTKLGAAMAEKFVTCKVDLCVYDDDWSRSPQIQYIRKIGDFGL